MPSILIVILFFVGFAVLAWYGCFGVMLCLGDIQYPPEPTASVMFDFFIDRDGKEYIVEVYSVEDNDAGGCFADDYGVYPLLRDGRKGWPVDNNPFDEEVQGIVYDRVTERLSDDVI
jgi:hypothetical protein